MSTLDNKLFLVLSMVCATLVYAADDVSKTPIGQSQRELSLIPGC